MYPQAGHAVRLTEATYWGDAGSIGIIDGRVNVDIKSPDEMLVVFRCRGSAFRGPNNAYSNGPEYVSCSGGPAFYVSPYDLRETGEIVRFPFWRWKDFPRADGGETYYLEIPIWDLTPPESLGPKR